LLCNEAAICDGAVPLYKQFAPGLGVDVATIIKAAVTQANYTSECLSFKQAGVDTILVGGPPLLKVANDCKRQGLSVKMATNDMTGVSPDVAKQFNVYTETTGFPVFQEFPETKPFFDALRKYHPEYLEGGAKYDSFVTGGTGGSIGPLAWSAGEAFKKAIENANVAASATVTRADVTKGLSMFKGETLGGIAPPLTFGNGTAANPNGKCFFVAGAENGKFIAPDGLKPTCQP
jgi:branched-chain amino acid transport system substrate-binding protein